MAADNIFAELGLYSSWCSTLVFAGEAVLCIYSLKVTALLMDGAFWYPSSCVKEYNIPYSPCSFFLYLT